MHSRVIWSHQFMYVAKKLAVFKVLPLEDLSLVQSVARSSSLTAKKGAYYARWRKKFGSILLTGWESVPGNCITASHASSTCNAAMQCSYAMQQLRNAATQCSYAMQLCNAAMQCCCNCSAGLCNNKSP